MQESFYDVMRWQGITRRSFLKYCSLTAAALGLGPSFAPKIAWAMENKPRIPVLFVNPGPKWDHHPGVKWGHWQLGKFIPIANKEGFRGNGLTM